MAVSRAAKDAPVSPSLSLTARLERPSLNQLIVVVVVVPTQTASERLHKFASLAK